jgi:hypothetical protein
MVLIFLLFLTTVGIAVWKKKPFFSERFEDNSRIQRQSSKISSGEKKIETLEETVNTPANKLDGDQSSPIDVNIFGRTRLNAEISKILTKKLIHFFAISNFQFGPIKKAIITGEVVVLRMEENWMETRQNYHSKIKVVLRNFAYEDQNRKIENEHIEVTVYAKGMVEDMLPLTAQALMNKIVDILFSDDGSDSDKSESN